MGEKDIQLILKQYNSHFTTYKTSPGIYSIKDITEVLSRGFKNEFEIRGKMRPNVKYDKSDSNIIESDNNTMRTKLIVNYDTMTMRFDEKS